MAGGKAARGGVQDRKWRRAAASGHVGGGGESTSGGGLAHHGNRRLAGVIVETPWSFRNIGVALCRGWRGVRGVDRALRAQSRRSGSSGVAPAQRSGVRVGEACTHLADQRPMLGAVEGREVAAVTTAGLRAAPLEASIEDTGLRQAERTGAGAESTPELAMRRDPGGVAALGAAAARAALAVTVAPLPRRLPPVAITAAVVTAVRGVWSTRIIGAPLLAAGAAAARVGSVVAVATAVVVTQVVPLAVAVGVAVSGEQAVAVGGHGVAGA